MKLFYLLLSFLFFSNLEAQTLFFEDFESGTIPSDWAIQTSSTDGGWRVGSSQSVSSAYFQIANNGSSSIAATNDDQCNCDKSADRFITPAIDLSNVSSALLSFESYFVDGNYQGAQENALIQVSTDKINWVTLEDVHGHGSWDVHRISLNDYAGSSQVYISFFYDDDGGWVFGYAIDNVMVSVPPALEVGLVENTNVPFAVVGESTTISALIGNNGSETINKLELSYSVNGGTEVIESFDGLDIASFDFYQINFSTPWEPTQAGDYNIEVTLRTVNDLPDNNDADNSFTHQIEVYDNIVVPNIIRDILNTSPKISTIASSANQLDKPSDLDFHPIPGKDELWIISQRNENSGGSTLTISNASETPTDMLHRVDGNAWHFMSIPTGIAFSDDNFNFATSPGVRDANHSGGTFTGPTLWSSDPLIYAQPSGGNGSHLDMLHGSPFSMGIAHEKDNVFWVYDNFNKSIVRYDFAEDHGPGRDDHSDGIVRRYNNMGITTDGDIPNHMILDKSTGWLYFVDNGNDRVLRLDINSGTSSTPLSLINEPLAEHSAVNGFDWEIIIEGLDQPCGIELKDNLLLVGEYGLGDIIVYDIDNAFSEVGRIETGLPGLTGIKVGTKGNIWYTNRLDNTVNKIEMGDPTSVKGLDQLANVEIYPNPTADLVKVNLPNDNALFNISVLLTDMSGKIISQEFYSSHQFELNYKNITPGQYILHLRTNDSYHTRSLIIAR